MGLAVIVLVAGPAQAFLVDEEINEFDILLLDNTPETFLTSQVRQRAGLAYIHSSLRTSAPDRLVHIHWTDHNGATILNFQAPGDFKSWITLDTQWVGLLFGTPSYDTFEGEADFTGFLNRQKLPCRAGLICPTLHLDWSDNAGSGPGGGPVPESGPGAATASGAAAAPPIRPLGGDFAGVTGTLASIASLTEDPLAPDDVDAAARAELAGFASSFEVIAGGYRYRYSATNSTTVPASFDFGVHGFAGTLDPGETATYEMDSPLAPGLQRIAPQLAALDPFNQDPRLVSGAVGMDVLTPVPEPAQVLLLLAGLAVVARRITKR